MKLYFFLRWYKGLIPIVMVLQACKHDASMQSLEQKVDKELYTMAIKKSGFVWYKNSNLLFDRSSASGHSQAFLKTRFNDVAAKELDSDGKIILGSKFKEGSLIVKELFSDQSFLSRYAILYKQANNINSDDKGWVWGYINSDGTIAVKSSKKGNDCKGCHSQSDNIDYVLMNKYFP